MTSQKWWHKYVYKKYLQGSCTFVKAVHCTLNNHCALNNNCNLKSNDLQISRSNTQNIEIHHTKDRDPIIHEIQLNYTCHRILERSSSIRWSFALSGLLCPGFLETLPQESHILTLTKTFILLFWVLLADNTESNDGLFDWPYSPGTSLIYI